MTLFSHTSRFRQRLEIHWPRPFYRMKLVFFIIAIPASAPVSAAQPILGEFSTVIGSECISEIHFSKAGKGVFVDYCNGIDNEGYKTSFVWRMENGAIHAKINGNEEIFRYQDKLSCSYIGKKGSADGLTGMDLYFWKKPVNCR